MKKGILIVLLALILVGSVFASGQSEPKQSAAPAETTPASKYGGTLVIGTTSTVASFNTLTMRGTDQFYENILYEALLVVGANGAIECVLAESYEGDPDALTYTIHLRKGVKFHDGSDFNAEVAKWNLEHYRDHGDYGISYLGVVESIDIVDDYTIVLHLSEWDAFLPVSLARGGGASYMMSKQAYDQYGDDYLRQHPVSTAPFMFDSYKEGEYIKLVKFKDYWKGEPYLDGITIEIYSEPMVLQAAFETGDVHITGVADGDTAKYLQDKGYNIVKSSTASMAYMLGFECNTPTDPFYDVRVRQAVCYAIDCEEIAKMGFEFNGTRATQLDPPGGQYYSPDVNPYDLNIEKAKELLAEAGYPNGFTTTLSTMSLWNLPIPAQMIVEQLKKIGITVKLNIVERAQFFILQDGWGSEGGMFLSCFSLPAGGGSQVAANFKQNLSSGFGRTSILHPDDVNELIVKANASSGEECAEYIKQAQVLIHNKYCVCYCMILANSLTAISDKVIDSNYGKDNSTIGTFHIAYLVQ